MSSQSVLVLAEGVRGTMGAGRRRMYLHTYTDRTHSAGSLQYILIHTIIVARYLYGHGARWSCLVGFWPIPRPRTRGASGVS